MRDGGRGLGPVEGGGGGQEGGGPRGCGGGHHPCLGRGVHYRGSFRGQGSCITSSSSEGLLMGPFAPSCWYVGEEASLRGGE